MDKGIFYLICSAIIVATVVAMGVLQLDAIKKAQVRTVVEKTVVEASPTASPSASPSLLMKHAVAPTASVTVKPVVTK